MGIGAGRSNSHSLFSGLFVLSIEERNWMKGVKKLDYCKKRKYIICDSVDVLQNAAIIKNRVLNNRPLQTQNTKTTFAK